MTSSRICLEESHETWKEDGPKEAPPSLKVIQISRKMDQKKPHKSKTKNNPQTCQEACMDEHFFLANLKHKKEIHKS